MKEFIHRSMALFMALVVLMTTTSFAMDMHYCGDTLVDYSFTQQAKSCGMEKVISTSDCETPTISQKSCCSDKQLVKESTDNFKVSWDQITPAQQWFISSLIYSYSNLSISTSTNSVTYADYSPPFIRQDVQVLHQTFLI